MLGRAEVRQKDSEPSLPKISDSCSCPPLTGPPELGMREAGQRHRGARRKAQRPCYLATLRQPCPIILTNAPGPAPFFPCPPQEGKALTTPCTPAASFPPELRGEERRGRNSRASLNPQLLSASYPGFAGKTTVATASPLCPLSPRLMSPPP